MRAAGLIAAGVLAALAAAAAPARAEPYFSVRSGAKCSDCHVNMTGGGMRTSFAHIHAHDILKDLQILPIPKGVKGFNGELNQWVGIGGDLRVRNTTNFQDRPNARGRVPENRAFREHVESNSFDVQEALFYGRIDLIPDMVSVYSDFDLDGGDAREVVGLLRGFLPWDFYVKGGRLYPAYGLRIWDDEAFVRSRTGYTFETPDEGVELGIAPGPVFVATSVTNGGNQDDEDVAATLNAYTVLQDLPVVRNVMAGGSVARQSNKRTVGGFYGGANLWTLTYLAEFDLIDDRTVASAQTGRDQYAAYAEVNWLVFDWLNLRGQFDFVKVANDRDQVRYVIGAEPFVDKYIQPRIQYRINNGPGSRPELNQDQLVVELHLWW